MSPAKYDIESKNIENQQKLNFDTKSESKKMFADRFVSDVQKYQINLDMFYNPHYKVEVFNKDQDKNTKSKCYSTNYSLEFQNTTKRSPKIRKKQDVKPMMENMFDSQIALSYNKRKGLGNNYSTINPNSNYSSIDNLSNKTRKNSTKFFCKSFTEKLFKKNQNQVFENAINKKKTNNVWTAKSENHSQNTLHLSNIGNYGYVNMKKPDSERNYNNFAQSYYKNYDENKFQINKPKDSQINDNYD